MSTRVRLVLAVAACLLAQAGGFAQEASAPPKPSLFKDPQDGAFDVSNWIATKTGVIPIVSPITEPAVGYGAALAFVLIHSGGLANMRNAPRGVSGRPVPPDISAVGGAYTENGTWAAFAAHAGFWSQDRWRYLGAAGRISPQFDVYDSSDRAYGINIDGWALVQELRRRVAKSDLFLGARFLYADTSTTVDQARLPDHEGGDGKQNIDSGLGIVAEYDTRDNIFTPNRGLQVRATTMFFDSAVGSDRDYQRYAVDGFGYWPVHPRLVLSGRLRAQTVRGDAPFYARPYVKLRGIPAMRYQGQTASSLDAEARWAVTSRWSLVGFAGYGVTDAGNVRTLKDESVVAGGAGFRYLVARLLGLHAGLDVAKGPEQWAMYIVFGSSW